MSVVHADLPRGWLLWAAERQLGHKQSECRARSSLNVSLSSFNCSHQQPTADALQGNFSPHASQVFCVGGFAAAFGPGVPAFMFDRL